MPMKFDRPKEIQLSHLYEYMYCPLATTSKSHLSGRVTVNQKSAWIRNPPAQRLVVVVVGGGDLLVRRIEGDCAVLGVVL